MFFSQYLAMFDNVKTNKNTWTRMKNNGMSCVLIRTRQKQKSIFPASMA